MEKESTENDENPTLDTIEDRLIPHLELDFTSEDEENEKNNRFWSHQRNLDDFFTRIYLYHQGHGFLTISLSQFFQLLQFIFIIFFTIFIFQCIDYPLLFQTNDSTQNGTQKRSFNDVFSHPKKCFTKMKVLTFSFFIVALIFCSIRFFWLIHNLFNNLTIRNFFHQVLKIEENELVSMTWQETQQKLIDAQRKHNFCVEKSDLSELDIQNRLMRFKNYEIAMVNKGILPVRISLPFFGSTVFLSENLKFNLRMILFEGPFSPFNKPWHLNDEYKSFSRREDLAEKLSRTISIYAILNIIFAPFVFFWQVLNFFYGYAEKIRREPGFLGSRRWSNFARLYFRHFNELDHLIDGRLSRAYKPASIYMNSFINYVLVEIAKFVSFISGSILAVFIGLTIYDEDVIQIEHMITMITGLGVIIGICQSLIPDENVILNQEELLQSALTELHYQPDSWRNRAHTNKVQCQFAEFYQLKCFHLIEEIFSPLITPFILYFYIRPYSLRIIDFLRQTTIQVAGLGDICSFAQLNIAKNGNCKWFAPVQPQKNEAEISEQGKVELSLINFHHTNPNWKMPTESEKYIERIQQIGMSHLESPSSFQRSTLETSQSELRNSMNYPRFLPEPPSPESDSQMTASRNFPRTNQTEMNLSRMNRSAMFESVNKTSNNLNSSCLFLQQLHHKYKYGDYRQLSDEDQE